MPRPGTGPAGAAIVATLASLLTMTVLTACAPSDEGLDPSGPPTSSRLSSARVSDPTTPIGSWYASVRPDVARLEQSITYAQRVVRRPDHDGLAAACRAIRTNVESVRLAPQAPDATVRHAVARESDAFDAAAVQCLSADYEQAGHSVNVGHRWAENGGRRLRSLLHLPAKAGALL